jgi:ABC-type polysaccharide/polyol phosphate transport system ATPase subunit/SAM-dependent methyltransferase
MNDHAVIEARDLTKVYKLYEKPQQKYLDMMGLLRKRTTVAEHYALDRVNLKINRGERVGIIGRNGAGKSTLLKLISGVTEPSSGQLRVDGSARALLEIGTGFHPEFTGRENVKAYLAQIGIAGREASRLLHEIVEFAELEEYIDQPLKAYSTGMGVRLMFATSTAVAPELLILDEVLGVGDAYFTRKSFDRIEEMCSQQGSTLLLVSHDMYSSAKLCARMVWLDRGKIVFDGEPAEAIKAYEESIREQEEHRLRKKATLALNRAGDGKVDAGTLWLEVATRTNMPQPSATYVSELAVELPDGSRLSVPLTGREAPLPAHAEAALVTNQGCWGDVAEHRGRLSRVFRNYGSPYHKAAGTLRGLAALPAGSVVVVTLASDEPCELVLRCFSQDRELFAVPLDYRGPDWLTERVALAAADRDQRILLEPQGVYGSGRLAVSDARLLDGLDRKITRVRHMDPARVQLDLLVRDPDLDEHCDITLAVLRDGVDTACRFFTRSLRLTGAQPHPTLQLTVPAMRLGAGRYTLAVVISRPGYADGPGDIFYTVNPDVHVAVRDLLEFNVTAEGVVARGTPWVADGDWLLTAGPDVLERRSAVAAADPERVPVDYPASLQRTFPEDFPVAWQAVEDVIRTMKTEDVRAIGANSPGMLDFDWPNYLQCSAARMVRVAQDLRLRGVETGRLLDYGSYFGNVTLMATRLGFQVDGLDSFNQYGGCFEPSIRLCEGEGARFLETDEVGRDLRGVPDATYDVVTFMGVIEHIPHTPRPLLAALYRVLKPGGILILDTPNHAYIYNRWRLRDGQSVHASISQQFNSPIPFEGHHREYIAAEMDYMLTETGFTELAIGLFDYSRFGISELAGITLAAARVTEQDWTARELVYVSCRKPE